MTSLDVSQKALPAEIGENFVGVQSAVDDQHALGLRAGEWVQVRSREEILATLDANGRLEELPFMPEMLKYCGSRMMVGKRAHKTCDPAIGIGGRKMSNTVHLSNIRCDGSAHDGCQAACLIFWKEAWLKRIEPDKGGQRPSPVVLSSRSGCTEEVLHSSIRIPPAPGETEQRYVCQNTQIKFATQPLSSWDLRQYLEDYTSGNVSLARLTIGLLYTAWRTVAEAGIGIGTPMRWVYDVFQRAIGGSPYPLRPAGVPKDKATPRATIDVQEGERVRVKSFPEILKTLDSSYRNRGLYFDPEMVPFTEREYEVERRVKQIIDERDGKMLRFKSDAIILKDVVCGSRYAYCRRFCPRAIPPYWREIWLERAPERHAPTDCDHS
ncbi:MAG: hypothetical protein R3D82_10575 [Xanthobacteraceae bacterium]